MDKNIKITKDDLILWIDRPPSNDDLELCTYLVNVLENKYKYYEENQQLQDRIYKAIELLKLCNSNCAKETIEILKGE